MRLAGILNNVPIGKVEKVMNSEMDFIKRLSDMVAVASDQGNVLSTDQISEAFPEEFKDDEKRELILNYFRDKKIGIDTQLGIEELVSEEEKNYLDFYLEDLAQLPVLTPNEKEGIKRSAMAGDDSAKGVLVQDFLKNVVEISKLYVGQGVMLEDLIGEGNIALVTAANMVDTLEKPDEIEGYLSSAVMDAMQDIIAQAMDEASEQEKMVAKVNKIADAAKELATLLGRKVTIEELMAESKFTETAIRKALSVTKNAIEWMEIV